jgi:hypothetical protein
MRIIVVVGFHRINTSHILFVASRKTPRRKYARNEIESIAGDSAGDISKRVKPTFVSFRVENVVCLFACFCTCLIFHISCFCTCLCFILCLYTHICQLWVIICCLRNALHTSLSKNLSLSKKLVVWAHGMCIPFGDIRKLHLE